MAPIRLAMAQLNMVLGDLEGNADRMIDAIERAEDDGCDIIAFPELAISGYPPEDLLLKPGFVDDNREALDRVVAATGRCAAIIGFVDRDAGGRYNALAVASGGSIRGTYRKRQLPNYEVFDERRYFTAGSEPLRLYQIAGIRVGVSICEDAWWPGGPIVEQALRGADLIVNINASPYHAGKMRTREQTLAQRADEACTTIVYVNLVGGQDELVFDGASLVVAPDGNVLARAGQYTEELYVVDIDVETSSRATKLDLLSLSEASRSPGPVSTPATRDLLDDLDEIYGALVLGTRDYVRKNGFSEVVLGLSGGVDSSLVAAIAVDALGAENVHGVLMPSRYSSEHSVSDAEVLAKNLDIDHRSIVIEPAFSAFLEMLDPSFAGMAEDTTEENLQPRIRGTLLMALSNKFNWMVLTTGNKSEMAVGYATLYGDMAGGFAVIKDVLKTTVFDLCRWRNERAGFELIPERVISKRPSAELRPDQYDSDSLPDYAVLDPILCEYIEHDRTAGEIIEMGVDSELVRRIARMVDMAEYKRRQAPPGVRVSTKAFGRDRRLPITNRYRG